MTHTITRFALARQVALGALIVLGLNACSQSPDVDTSVPAQPASESCAFDMARPPGRPMGAVSGFTLR